MSSKIYLGITMVILLFSLGLRGYLAGMRRPWIDELHTMRVIHEGALPCFSYLQNDVHPPLYFVSFALYVKAFTLLSGKEIGGLKERWIWGLNIMFGLLLIVVLMRIAEMLADRNTALLVGMISVVQVGLLYQTLELRPYILLALCYAGAVLLLMKGKLFSTFWSPLVLVALFLTQYLGIVLLLTIGVACLFPKFRKKNPITKAGLVGLGFSLLLILVNLPLFFYQIMNHYDQTHLMEPSLFFWQHAFIAHFTGHGLALYFPLRQAILAELVTTFFYLVGLVWIIFRKDVSSRIFLVLFVTPLMLLYATSFFHLRLLTYRHVTFVFAASIVIVALGVRALGRLLGKRKIVEGLLVAILLFVLGQPLLYYVLKSQAQENISMKWNNIQSQKGNRLLKK